MPSSKRWYLGIWFNKVSQLTPIWVGNRESPVVGPHRMSKLAISQDGNLAVFNEATKSMVWSTRAGITAKNTTAVLLDNGNLVLRDASNSCTVLWQSFDYPTDILAAGAKLGLDKITGLNRQLVSKRSLIDPSSERYCLELDPSGAAQFVFKLCNTSIMYWSRLLWNEQDFNLVPELSGKHLFEEKFINDDKEEYFQYKVLDENMIAVSLLDISGQYKLLVSVEDAQELKLIFVQPQDECDVYATCGPFTICYSNTLPPCDCMTGFSVRSPKEWEQRDRAGGAGGCIRNTPLDCSTMMRGQVDKYIDLIYCDE